MSLALTPMSHGLVVPGCGWWWAGSRSRCDSYPAQCRGVACGGRGSGRDATAIPPSAGALVGEPASTGRSTRPRLR